MSETSRTRSGAGEGGSLDEDGSPTENSLLTELRTESPFDRSGSLPAATIERLRGLDPASLGQATVLLVDQAARLSPDDGAAAAASIEHLLGEGADGQPRVEHDVPALVAIYASLVADPSRPDISRLIAWLLRNTPRDEVFATVGTDARSLTVRARLSVDLDAAAMAVEAAPERPTRGVHTRGWARAKPPERAGPPTGRAEARRGDRREAADPRSPTNGREAADTRSPADGRGRRRSRRRRRRRGAPVGAEPGEPATANGAARPTGRRYAGPGQRPAPHPPGPNLAPTARTASSSPTRPSS